MAARQGEQLLAVGGARPVEPPKAQNDARPARLRESVHIRLRGKVPARHRIAVDGRVLVTQRAPWSRYSMLTDSWTSRSTPAASAASTTAAEPSVRTRSLLLHALALIHRLIDGIAVARLTTASWPVKAASAPSGQTATPTKASLPAR